MISPFMEAFILNPLRSYGERSIRNHVPTRRRRAACTLVFMKQRFRDIRRVLYFSYCNYSAKSKFIKELAGDLSAFKIADRLIT